MANRGPVPAGRSADAKPHPLAGSAFYSMTQRTQPTAAPGAVTVTTGNPRAASSPDQLDDLARPVNPSPVVTAGMPSAVLPTRGAGVARAGTQQIPVQSGDPGARMSELGRGASGISRMWGQS